MTLITFFLLMTVAALIVGTPYLIFVGVLPTVIVGVRFVWRRAEAHDRRKTVTQ